MTVLVIVQIWYVSGTTTVYLTDKHPHREWGCFSPEINILTGNGDVTHRECTSSPGMGM